MVLNDDIPTGGGRRQIDVIPVTHLAVIGDGVASYLLLPSNSEFQTRDRTEADRCGLGRALGKGRAPDGTKRRRAQRPGRVVRYCAPLVWMAAKVGRAPFDYGLGSRAGAPFICPCQMSGATGSMWGIALLRRQSANHLERAEYLVYRFEIGLADDLDLE
jgi:hypothetical protein